MTGANQIRIFESGSSKGQFGNFIPSDVFRVEVLGNSVKYIKNGNVFYTSTKAPIFPLNIDTSLHYKDAVISNVSLN